MGREISLFSDYRQKENSLTNHCGLVFRLVYRESPRQFEELIFSLISNEAQIRVGPFFTQQEKKQNSIPDLLIHQDAFSLFFETKIDDWFHDSQLAQHVEALSKATGTKVLFCLSNFEDDSHESRFKKLITEAQNKGIVVRFISFEDLMIQIRSLQLSNALAEIVDEFEQYLDRNNLLPRWKYLLDVVNCGKTMDEIKAGAYMCPNRTGPHSHVRARYLGTYQTKNTPTIHEVDALVVCEPGGNFFEVRWNNNGQSNDDLIARAREMTQKHSHEMHLEILRAEGLQIFLLGKTAKTAFRKDSPGGLLNSHIYFWDISKKVGAENVEELAEKLKGRNWSEFGH